MHCGDNKQVTCSNLPKQCGSLGAADAVAGSSSASAQHHAVRQTVHRMLHVTICSPHAGFMNHWI
jgi:hypothetical protein